jgi:hypothetical protein
MREYRGFWPEYWWVCLGSFVVAGAWAWLTWVPPHGPSGTTVLDTSCKGIEHPVPGSCELHTR